MSIRDQNPNLTPAEARLAELHLRRKWGEALSEAEAAELSAAAPETLRLLEELDRASVALETAASTAKPSANFAKKVMSALPAKAVPVGDGALFVARKSGGGHFWMATAIAAMVALAVTVALTLWRTPSGGVTAKNDAGPVLVKGQLTDAGGRAVTQIAAGQTYRTGANDVVLKVSDQSLLRITPHTEFEALPTENQSVKRGLHLRKGALYAKESGPQPLLVRAPAFDTEVEDGVAWVMQDELEGESTLPAQSVVLVFKGTALVHVAGEVLTVGEGELYVAGAPVEPLHVFLENAPQAAAAEEGTPESMQQRRKRYREVIDGYRADLKLLDSELENVTDPGRLKEIKARRERVHALLKAHRDRLDTMTSAGDEERPAKQRSLRRTIEKVREGQQGFTDPATWM
ncbi:MAG: FecR domain-containing protein [Planctomycetota bacterium]|nr:FecR domain-containing protein [Planctomycetota bacterium]